MSINCRATVVLAIPDDGTTEMQTEHGENKFRPGTVVATYYAEDGANWRLYNVKVSGPKIRKNGALSQAISHDRTFGPYSDPIWTLPAHIAALVEQNQPRAFA